MKAVAYYRVSTKRQGSSGLGLEAQKEAVRIYAHRNGIEVEKDFIEVESGRKRKRPLLSEALNHCRKEKVLLIIAKLDRLGRNVAFISALMEGGVEFVAVDFPEANHLILHILAAVAQYEAEINSDRTKAALRAAKARGIELGKNGKKLALINKELSAQFKLKMQPIIDSLKADGYNTIQAITDELNHREVPSFRIGAKWHKSTVHAVMHY